MKKITYVTLRDLAEFNKIDKELLTDFLIEKAFLTKEKMKLVPTAKGQNYGIHMAKGKFGEFILFDKNMEFFGLTKYRKFGIDSKKKAGNDYEIFIGNYYEKKGYIVKYNGIENGIHDNSIDLIAIKKEEILLIQCKNWSLDWVKKNKKEIDEKELKSFLGDVSEFIKTNKVYQDFKIKKIFVVSNSIFSKSGYAFIKNTPNLEMAIIPMKKY